MTVHDFVFFRLIIFFIACRCSVACHLAQSFGDRSIEPGNNNCMAFLIWYNAANLHKSMKLIRLA